MPAEMADPMTEQLKMALRATMSQDRAARTQAEEALKTVEQQAGFTIKLLELIQAALAPTATPEDKAVQQVQIRPFVNHTPV